MQMRYCKAQKAYKSWQVTCIISLIFLLFMTPLSWSSNLKKEQLAEEITRYLKEEHGAEAFKKYQLRFSGSLNLRKIYAEEQTTPEIMSVSFNKERKTFEALCMTEKGEVSLHGTLIPLIRVPVPREIIQKDTPLTEDLFEWKDIPERHVHVRTIQDTETLSGKNARTRLMAQHPINTGQTYAPILVQRNKNVSIVLQTKHMSIKTYGKSLDPGALGDYIRVQNLDSKKILTGRINQYAQVVVSSDEGDI